MYLGSAIVSQRYHRSIIPEYDLGISTVSSGQRNSQEARYSGIDLLAAGTVVMLRPHTWSTVALAPHTCRGLKPLDEISLCPHSSGECLDMSQQIKLVKSARKLLVPRLNASGFSREK